MNSFYGKYVKRILDFLISLIAIVLLSPVLLLLTVIGAISMEGNPFFVQERPGKINKKTGKEKIFKMYKFRTMKAAVDKYGRKLTDVERLNLIEKYGENSVSSDAERITKYGEFIRKLSLDELPELFNILIGNMSIVGPRPLAVIYLPYYTEQERHRHDVLPGLTGLAQVNGRNAISWEKRFEYDLEYVNNISLAIDLKIIIKTIKVVFKHNDIAQGSDRPEAFNIERQNKIKE